MKPESYREQFTPCCNTCVHKIEVYKIGVPICKFGENLTIESFNEDMLKERSNRESEYYLKNSNFDIWRFVAKWCENREIDPLNICDNYEAVKQ